MNLINIHNKLHLKGEYQAATVQNSSNEDQSTTQSKEEEEGL